MISKKQRKILAFPFSRYDALICDGAVRSGKTSIMTYAFIDWAMREFNGRRFAICGKTVDSATKNIIVPFMAIPYVQERFAMRWRRTDKVLEVRRGSSANYFEVFGGKDESSYTLIQGRTLAGVLLDEVTLMPESFVNQALARCSVTGAKIWFSCNPAGPGHWFYKEWVQGREKHNALRLHFEMTDNPGLSAETLARYETMFSGVFYDRYIRGLWVLAEGLIYPGYANTVKAEPRGYDRYYISMDYGILNPTAMLLWGRSGGKWYAVREYYHSGRETKEQKTDAQYYDELERLAGDLPITSVIVDPSAASFITLVEQKRRFKVMDADNAVLEGIQHVAQCLSDGIVLINDCCTSTIKEFGEYCWDEKATEDKPVKTNDHAMDAVRYFVQTVCVWRAPGRSVPWLMGAK